MILSYLLRHFVIALKRDRKFAYTAVRAGEIPGSYFIAENSSAAAGIDLLKILFDSDVIYQQTCAAIGMWDGSPSPGKPGNTKCGYLRKSEEILNTFEEITHISIPSLNGK